MARAARSRRKLTWKKPLLILAGVVALLILILLSLTLFLDMNQFKPSLETEISKALGRQVQFGDVHLALFSGGVTIDNVSIADDPSFSHSPFMTAKQLTVGVSLLPLIFSKKLEVRSFTAVEPDVSLLRSASGVWNFSSLTGSAKPASRSAGPPSPIDFSVEKLAVKNGRINLATAGPGGARSKPQVYEDVDLEASDLSYTSKFPFHFSAKTLGNGAIKMDGNAGPIDSADASLTPLEAKISMQHMDVASSGFIDPSAGLAGLIGFAGDLTSDGHQLSSKGTLNAEKIKLAAAGSPSAVSLNVDYDTNFDLKRQAGEFKLGEVHIGKSLAHLSGTYAVAGASATVQIKVAGKSMSVADVEGILPALGVKLPPGSALQSGTLDVNLVITGPIDKLTITGPINLSNAKLAGFNLKSKLGALGSFAGIGGGNEPDTDIQTLAADVQMDPTGTQAQNLTIVVPSIGTITGKGSLDSGGHLDCRMLAKLVGIDKNPVGAMASVVTSFGSGGKMEGGGIPFLIQGTTSDPIFLPDVAGMAGNLGKGAARAPVSAVGAATGAIGGLFGKKKKPQQ